jgi:hypothetical protein
MRHYLLAALAALPLVSVAQTPPPADSVGVLVVGEPPDGPSAELADMAGPLRSTIAARVGGVLTADELRRRMAGQGRGATLVELDRAYAGAVAAFQSGEYESSARTLRAVIDDLERMPEGDEVFSAWSRAILRLARAEGSLGRKGEARDVMERLLRADPGAKADPELYPPSFGRQLDEVRAALKAAAPRKLTITAGGKPAKVFIEGRAAGSAPVTVSLPPGRYRISGALGEVRVSAGAVDLTQEDQTVAVDFTVASTFRPAAGPGLAVAASARSRGIIAAGATLKLDRVAVAALEKDGDVRYLLGGIYDIRRGILEREGRLRLAGSTPPDGGFNALSDFLLTGQASGLVLARKDEPPKTAPLPPEVRDEPSPYRGSALMRWSPVASGTLALGLGAFAVIKGFSSNSSFDDANALADDGVFADAAESARFNQLVAEGDDARRASLISGVGAAACAVTSGILGYLSYRQTGEVGPFRF